MPKHADTDADTINAVLEEAGKFAAEVIFPLNISGDTEGCTLNRETHEVTTPKGFKEAYAQYVDGRLGRAELRPRVWRPGPAALWSTSAFYEMMNSANEAWTMYPGLTHGAYASLHDARHARAEGHLPAQNDQR
jgi:hypothetical protein